MANVANLLISLTLCSFYTNATSYHVNSTAHTPTQDRLLKQEREQINSTSIHIVNNCTVKRKINTNPHTFNLVVSTRETLYKILSPNYKWDHLYDLHIDNNLSQICLPRDYLQIGIGKNTCEIVLPLLMTLKLSNFTNCELLLDKIINCFKMGQLQTIKFSSSIDDEFVQQFQEFLRKNYGSIKEIYLSGLLLTRINVFEIRANYALRNVSGIYLKPRLEKNVAIARNIINDRFCSIFPNLIKLGIKKAVVDLEQILKLQNCTKLKYIKAIVHLGKNDVEKLLLINWKSQFPDLENIAVKLIFDDCPAPRIFEQITNHMTHFRNYIVCSNCNLTTNRFMKCTQRAKLS